MSFFDKFKKGKKQTPESGYVSFTEEDLKEAQQNNAANERAYELLDAAMTTSSNITGFRDDQTVDVDDIYPVTEAECDEMDALLDQAQEAVVDKNDTFFHERHDELREIVKWSRKKHWTFKWSLIGGCILGVFGLSYCSDSAKEDVANEEKTYAMIEHWAEQDTTIAYDAIADYRFDYGTIDNTANLSKAYVLKSLYNQCESAKKSAKEYQQRADTATITKNKKAYLEWVEKENEYAEKYRKEYDEINAMKFKDFQKRELKKQEARVEDKKGTAGMMKFLYIYVLLLIPAYIWSSHQYGYNITRHRAETAVLGTIQKVSFSIASFFFGAGLAMALLPDTEVTTHYSDGTTTKHTEGNSLNIVIMLIKAGLIFVGLCIFCFVSILLMTYVTYAAIKRAYDWKKVANSAIAVTASAANMAADKIKESGIMDKKDEASSDNTEK